MKRLLAAIALSSAIAFAQSPVVIQQGGNAAGVTAGGLLKVDPSGVTSPISAASLPLPTGAATSAKQPALGTAGTASTDVLTVQGIASMTPLKVDPSAVTSPISAASLPLPTGAATSAKQPALGTAGTASTDVLTVQGIASMTPLKVDPSGVTSPVSISGTPSVAQSGVWNVGITGTAATSATQSGTWTVQPGNTQNTTPWLANPIPSTASSYALASAPYTNNAITTAVTPKSSAGNVYAVDIENPNASVCWLQFYNSASPTLGTSVVFAIPVLSTGGISRTIPFPVNFSTAISIAATTTATGSTACATGLGVTLYYQ